MKSGSQKECESIEGYGGFQKRGEQKSGRSFEKKKKGNTGSDQKVRKRNDRVTMRSDFQKKKVNSGSGEMGNGGGVRTKKSQNRSNAMDSKHHRGEEEGRGKVIRQGDITRTCGRDQRMIQRKGSAQDGAKSTGAKTWDNGSPRRNSCVDSSGAS